MLNAARAQGRPMIVIAMTTAATSQPNAIHAPPSTIQITFRSSETGDMVSLYLAGDAIGIENGYCGIDSDQASRSGTRLPRGAQAVNCVPARSSPQAPTGRSVDASARIRLVSAHAWRHHRLWPDGS